MGEAEHVLSPVDCIWEPSRDIAAADGLAHGMTFAATPGHGGFDFVQGQAPLHDDPTFAGTVGSYGASPQGQTFQTRAHPETMVWEENDAWGWSGGLWSIFISVEVTGHTGDANFAGLANQRENAFYPHGSWQWYRWPTAFSSWTFQWSDPFGASRVITWSHPWAGNGHHTWAMVLDSGRAGTVPNARFYEDGALVQTPKSMFGLLLPQQSSPHNLSIGKTRGGQSLGDMYGDWESIYIWDRMLTAEEVFLMNQDPFLPLRQRRFQHTPTRLGLIGSLQGTASLGPRLTGTASAGTRISGTASSAPRLSGTASSATQLTGDATIEPRLRGTAEINPDG